jgi:hypothetical protein
MDWRELFNFLEIEYKAKPTGGIYAIQPYDCTFVIAENEAQLAELMIEAAFEYADTTIVMVCMYDLRWHDGAVWRELPREEQS